MKTRNILVLVGMLIGTAAQSQTINWANIDKQHRHVLSGSVALQNGVQLGAGYSYLVNRKLFPVFLHVDYASLSGNNLLDDFRSTLGGKIRWFHYKNFQFTTGVYGVFRRYQNDYVRLANFGSDINGTMGYYRHRWFVGAEVGFDKAIVTHFKHSAAYKAQYPGVVNGWYETSTGGNFYYGLQAGFTFRKVEAWLKGGKSLEQDFETKPLVPVYAQVGVNVRL